MKCGIIRKITTIWSKTGCTFRVRFFTRSSTKIPGVHEVKQEGKMKKPSFIKRFFSFLLRVCVVLALMAVIAVGSFEE